MQNIFEMAQKPLEKASALINLSPNAAKLIAQPERTLEVQVHARQEELMVDAFEKVWQAAQTHKTDMRVAAYIVALERLAEGMRLRGWYE